MVLQSRSWELDYLKKYQASCPEMPLRHVSTMHAYNMYLRPNCDNGSQKQELRSGNWIIQKKYQTSCPEMPMRHLSTMYACNDYLRTNCDINLCNENGQQ